MYHGSANHGHGSLDAIMRFMTATVYTVAKGQVTAGRRWESCIYSHSICFQVWHAVLTLHK